MGAFPNLTGKRALITRGTLGAGAAAAALFREGSFLARDI